ncbi:chromosome segregation protein SMC [Alkalihalobacillus sp. LMS39]|uniref:chromosome segregation protein SMC n=1 Tax=Alkalihalobacillus sp. LMS39 TaxID=2924032 RepID=UPI001FB41CDA|nr:chromosome segregation protein SMC [Alkalihalobacillus sp. LMS39]UOE92870.1 chromosome segregation protein SMC [Alkalihalobacillus sp. LMS39]
MFLKRLEVMGFKSFADKMSIEFDKGVTAVVGPNGSGKSNISDGVRWVLGEQSAKSLRGSKMEDIIFAGSDTRKPLNFAEISLVLDNEDQYIPIDYTEVSVTRRVYRSGDSEYFINKQSCRLKDIVDLFLDSGLGKEAYSIIGQGKVEEILSSKGEDRRVIFEEAAGVLKYKTRKVKAERKLAETQENLYRVEDIIHELEGQIEPLQIQASIAKDYLAKKEELKNVDVALIVHEITELHQEWTEAKSAIEQLEEQHKQMTVKVTESEETVASLRTEMKQLDDAMSHWQEQLLSASEELEKSEGQKEVLKERKKNFSLNREQLLKQLEEAKSKRAKYEQLLSVEQEKLQQVKEAVLELQDTVNGKQDAMLLAAEDLEQKLEQLKSDYIEVLNEQASLRNEIRYIEEQLKQTDGKSNRLVESNEHLIQTRESIILKKQELAKQLDEKQQSLNEKVSQFRALQVKLEQQKNDYQKKQTQLFEAYQHIQQVRSRKEVLEEMQSDFSGFFQGVKEVLKARGNQLQGIVGAVAELVTVPKEYETAIEIALGGATQHIVVESEAAARQAIGFLKKNRLGRSTFLPLPVIKARFVPSQQLSSIKGHSSFVGIASDLVQYEKRYEQVLSNLLGHVLVAKDLQGANEIANITGYKMRIVTLDGDVINPGGSMTGGSVKKNTTPLLGRQRELEGLQEKLVMMEEKTAQAEANVKKIKDMVANNEQQLEKLREQGEQAREAEQAVKAELREIELEEKSVNERLTLFDREQHNYENEKKQMQSKMEGLRRELSSLSTSAKVLEQEVDEIEQKKKQQQSSKETLQTEITDLKIQLAKEEERFVNQKETVARLQEEYSQIAQQASEIEEQYWLLENEFSKNTSGEETIDEKIERNRQQKENMIGKIRESKEARTKLEANITTLEHAGKQDKNRLKLLVDDLHRKEVRVNRLDVELDNRLTMLREEYEMSYDYAKEHYPLSIDVEEARTKVKLIKLAIDELGTVNIGAIEEYERVNERYQFLQEQQQDLVEAKETLYNVIREMDEEMTKRFSESFSQIRSHFQVVFKELFGGGGADLILTDPDNLLLTGVDIVARPPGKKLQHLALLSGGERALTAIALLFAILKVRPVPFCVLDEVEAALDEANVSRFARYLKVFSGDTQFIVITHRKGTMEEADVLYGVTMQESGVSRLVSVRLEDTKELVES